MMGLILCGPAGNRTLVRTAKS